MEKMGFTLNYASISIFFFQMFLLRRRESPLIQPISLRSDKFLTTYQLFTRQLFSFFYDQLLFPALLLRNKVS